jgi:hypothetical protein
MLSYRIILKHPDIHSEVLFVPFPGFSHIGHADPYLLDPADYFLFQFFILFD